MNTLVIVLIAASFTPFGAYAEGKKLWSSPVAIGALTIKNETLLLETKKNWWQRLFSKK